MALPAETCPASPRMTRNSAPARGRPLPTCATAAATVGEFPVLLSKLVTFRAPPPETRRDHGAQSEVRQIEVRCVPASLVDAISNSGRRSAYPRRVVEL